MIFPYLSGWKGGVSFSGRLTRPEVVCSFGVGPLDVQRSRGYLLFECLLGRECAYALREAVGLLLESDLL